MKGPKKKAEAPAEPAPKLMVDVAAVRALAEIAEAHGLSEIKFENAEVLLVLRRQAAPSPAHAHVVHPPPAISLHPTPAAQAPQVTSLHSAPEPKSAENGQYVTVASPFVGTFYRSPGPDAAPFVELGQRVKKGQVLCIVEAMKLMNELEADVDGTIAAVLVENAQPVEYGQPLFKISP
jgi:acetyl-CoA carboxylase biotin carboxyl carrier protein